MQPQLAAAAADIKIEGLKQWGIAQNVTATIQNTGTEDFIGSVDCGIHYVEDGVLKVLKRVFQTGLMVEAGGTSDIFYGLSVPHAGEFVFLLTRGGVGKDISGSKVADIIRFTQRLKAHDEGKRDGLFHVEFQVPDGQHVSYETNFFSVPLPTEPNFN